MARSPSNDRGTPGTTSGRRSMAVNHVVVVAVVVVVVVVVVVWVPSAVGRPGSSHWPCPFVLLFLFFGETR